MPHTQSVSSIDIGMDGHVHTRLCNHASGTMEEYVQAALDKGLHTLCFLEHFETGINHARRSWLRPRDISLYFEEGERLKRLYRNRITILLGVETGFNPEFPDVIKEVTTSLPWDRIGLSCHFIRVGNEHLNLLSRKPDGLAKLQAYGTERVFATYFNGLYEALNLIRVDVVCHLDAAMRHIKGIHLSAQDYRRVDNILAVMRKKDISLEVNTSGYKIRGEPFPNAVIIKKAVDLGIKLELGSDAHSPEEVARFFPQCTSHLQVILQGTRTE